MGLRFLRPRSHLLFQLANPRAVIFHKAEEGVGGFHTPARASPQSPVTGNCSPGHCPEHTAGTRADDLGGGERDAEGTGKSRDGSMSICKNKTDSFVHL